MRQNKKKHRLAEVSSRRRGCRVWCSVHLYIYSRGLPANPSATTTPTSPATILTLHPHSHNPCHTLLFLFTTAVTGRSSSTGPIIMQPLLFFFLHQPTLSYSSSPPEARYTFYSPSQNSCHLYHSHSPMTTYTSPLSCVLCNCPFMQPDHASHPYTKLNRHFIPCIR